MFVFTVEFARSSGHYKWYRESRCHRYLLSEFQEIFSQLYDGMKYHKEHCYNQNIRIVTIKIFDTDHVYVKYVKIASCLQRH